MRRNFLQTTFGIVVKYVEVCQSVSSIVRMFCKIVGIFWKIILSNIENCGTIREMGVYGSFAWLSKEVVVSCLKTRVMCMFFFFPSGCVCSAREEGV